MNKKQMPLKEIAARIDQHLKRLEAEDTAARKASGGNAHYYCAGAWATPTRVSVTYVTYQGSDWLTRAEAEQYLESLDSGSSAKHFQLPSLPQPEPVPTGKSLWRISDWNDDIAEVPVLAESDKRYTTGARSYVNKSEMRGHFETREAAVTALRDRAVKRLVRANEELQRAEQSMGRLVEKYGVAPA